MILLEVSVWISVAIGNNQIDDIAVLQQLKQTKQQAFGTQHIDLATRESVFDTLKKIEPVEKEIVKAGEQIDKVLEDQTMASERDKPFLYEKEKQLRKNPRQLREIEKVLLN